MKFSELKGIFKKSVLKMESVENVYGDYYQVKMISEDDLYWKAGEHGIFRLPDRDVRGRSYRVFSVASASKEGFIMIGTRTGKKTSSFKSELLSMKKGEKVIMNGPFGHLIFKDENTPIVMLAGGVGITPFRAMLKELENSSSRSINLIYSSSSYYLFGGEIEKIAEKNDKINLIKTSNRKETKIILDDISKQFKDDAFYYLSGPNKFVKSLKEELLGKSINRKMIKTDDFFGG